MTLLNIKDKYLKKLRDNGYLGYSREGDKYWYTKEDVNIFLRRFHYEPYASTGLLPMLKPFFVNDVPRAIDSRQPFGAFKQVMAYYGLLNYGYRYRDDRYMDYVRRVLGLE